MPVNTVCKSPGLKDTFGQGKIVQDWFLEKGTPALLWPKRGITDGMLRKSYLVELQKLSR
jgi:hypothetical protein